MNVREGLKRVSGEIVNGNCSGYNFRGFWKFYLIDFLIADFDKFLKGI